MLFWHAETKKRPETIGPRALDARMPRRYSGASTFFHPDCTVGFGVSACSHCRRITESCPAGLYSERLVGYTTGWDLHPTLKNFTFINVLSI